ncbi:unnamed protein product, partial [Rotaria magnacalcarata]
MEVAKVLLKTPSLKRFTTNPS